MNKKERVRARRILGYQHYLLKALSLCPDKNAKDTIRKLLRTGSEKTWMISGGGPIIKVRILDGVIIRSKAEPEIPTRLTKIFQQGMDFCKSIQIAQARKEKVTILCQ